MTSVTLPLVAPAIVASGVLVLVLSADEFNVASFLGVNAHFLTIPYGAYGSFINFPPSPGRSAALGLMLMVVTVIGMALYLQTVRRSGSYVTMSDRSAVPARHRLGLAGRRAAITAAVFQVCPAQPSPAGQPGAHTASGAW